MRNELTQARLREVLFYDQFDGKWTWVAPPSNRVKVGAEAGSIDESGRRRIWVDWIRYRSSRLAFLYVKGRWPRGEVDHCDGDESNDAFLNLREATRSQNEANKPPRADSTSGKKWTSRTRSGRRWQARVKVHGKYRRLGTFDTAEEAHMAAWSVAREAYGEFARRA